ncbi:hypothetical protein TEA_027161 [Camellia sinensis var. sinensis]|uniref:Leucine-rich repeat-containing N-terminal plant-type domain-containing protein n=1 Tax=Camellia sinensis var. sinensis TaxID=542762 RepID=A0A4S4E7N5_CAMSN|nr:hypothetical protein TEA_027161 [Camellia sinensis var. sinensis]
MTSSLQIIDLSRTSFSCQVPDSISNLKALNSVYLIECNFSRSIPASLGNLNKSPICLRRVPTDAVKEESAKTNGVSRSIPFSSTIKQWCPVEGVSHLAVAFECMCIWIAAMQDHLKSFTVAVLCLCLFGATMEEALLFQKKKKKLVFYSVMLAFMLLFPLASPLKDEGKALMSIKASFNNIANVLLDWDDVHNDNFCSWRGIFYDNITLSVVSLNLSNLNLGGEISPAIGDLKNLQSMYAFFANPVGLVFLLIVTRNLKNNQLTGPIPSTLTQIPNLKTLGLRGNSLTGTLSPDMCQLTSLCDVRGNNLTGTIPDNIGNCTSFEILDISYNQISGEIPYNIGFLQVATLSLQGNRLAGKIPEVIGLMQALAVLDLSENELVRPIPPILGNLYLHGNKLTGPIPPELGNMSKLSYLQLNGNQLVGGIPTELGKLEQLFELYASSILDSINSDCTTGMQSLMEATKKAQEEASEHVRCLEEDLGKLSTSFLLMENGGMMSTNHFAQNFAGYVTSWRRVISIERFEELIKFEGLEMR